MQKVCQFKDRAKCQLFDCQLFDCQLFDCQRSDISLNEIQKLCQKKFEKSCSKRFTKIEKGLIYKSTNDANQGSKPGQQTWAAEKKKNITQKHFTKIEKRLIYKSTNDANQEDAMIEYDFQIIERFWDEFWAYCQEHNIKREEIEQEVIEALEHIILKVTAINY